MANDKEVTPVEIVTPSPVPVEVVAAAPPPPAFTVIKGEGVTLPPKTTEQEDIVTAGQRHINRIWEVTQSVIALLVVISGVFVNSILITLVMTKDVEITSSQLSLISISLQFINLTTGIIIGFYFSRTNHSAQGGVGTKPTEPPYIGR